MMPMRNNLPFLCHFKQKTPFCSLGSASESGHYVSRLGFCLTAIILRVFIYIIFIFMPCWLITTSRGWTVIPAEALTFIMVWSVVIHIANERCFRKLLPNCAKIYGGLDSHILLATIVLLLQLLHHKFSHFL